jgi:hypothetical protein
MALRPAGERGRRPVSSRILTDRRSADPVKKSDCRQFHSFPCGFGSTNMILQANRGKMCQKTGFQTTSPRNNFIRFPDLALPMVTTCPSKSSAHNDRHPSLDFNGFAFVSASLPTRRTPTRSDSGAMTCVQYLRPTILSDFIKIWGPVRGCLGFDAVYLRSLSSAEHGPSFYYCHVLFVPGIEVSVSSFTSCPNDILPRKSAFESAILR